MTNMACTSSAAVTIVVSGRDFGVLSYQDFDWWQINYYRLWNLESKTCVQEITAHRKKFDESIFDVAFHTSRPYIASAGNYRHLNVP